MTVEATGDAETARPELVFRAVNDRIKSLEVGPFDIEVDFFCECGDGDCFAVVTLRLSEYEELHARPDRFVVLPGHDVACHVVLEQTARYAVLAPPLFARGDLGHATAA